MIVISSYIHVRGKSEFEKEVLRIHIKSYDKYLLLFLLQLQIKSLHLVLLKLGDFSFLLVGHVPFKTQKNRIYFFKLTW